MISKSTAEKIYHCHREIEAGEKLLEEIKKMQEKARDNHTNEPGLEDVFGRTQNLQLSIPSGKDSHRLFYVSWGMAEPIIKTHIANKKALLVEVCQMAVIEEQAPDMGETDGQ